MFCNDDSFGKCQRAPLPFSFHFSLPNREFKEIQGRQKDDVRVFLLLAPSLQGLLELSVSLD